MGRAAAIYCRISQDREGAGLGVARQREDCTSLARERGWPVSRVYVDNDTSAYSGKPRPEYEHMLNDIRAGLVNAVIVWHSDRLHRRLIELEAFIDLVNAYKVEIATCTGGDIDLSTSDGRFLARVIGSAARKESEDKSRRTRRKHRELAENGMVPGGGLRPFGFEADRVTIKPAEAEEIRSAARRILAGESLRGVTHDWRARGVQTVTGALWSPTTVKRLLCSGRVSGQREHRDPDEAAPGRPAQLRIVGPAVWPAIITPEETARLRAVLGGHGPGPGSARTYLLTGFVVCGRCATVMSARAATRKGHRYRRYHCAKDRGGCDRVGISATGLENLIVAAVLERLNSPRLAELMAAGDTTDEARAIETVQGLEGQLEQMARDYGAGVWSRGEWLAARSKAEPRLVEAREVAARYRPANVLDGIPAGVGALAGAWPGLSLARRRAVLGVVLESVTVGATTRANNRFDPVRVLAEGGGLVRWRI